MLIRNLLKFGFAYSKNIVPPSQISYKTDYYRSVHLTINGKIQEANFNQYIDKVLQVELQNNKRMTQDQQCNAIWVHLKSEQFGLASYLCKKQFSIHHALGDKMSLYKWIAKKKDLVTPYSTIYVSAGALIIKDQKVFLVQEKNGPRKGDFGIPGGRADFGQTIPSCSERQLLQETNIKAKFRQIIHFRQLQKTAFGAMDIYFACLMQYQDSSFDNIKLCERELNSYKWVHLSEYEQFCAKHSVGTQLQLSKYVTKLYKSGYDFKKRHPNETIYQKYTSPRDKIQRLVVQHGLVEGVKIDKSYL